MARNFNFKRMLHGLILAYLILALISPFFLNVKAGSTTVTLTATDDSYVDSSTSGSNFNNNYLKVGHYYSSEYIIYVKFDLSSIPSNAVIVSAKLKLTDQSSSSIAVDVHRVTGGDWSEGSITWNNKPSYDSAVIDSATTGNDGDVIEWDVTDVVQGWVDGSYSNYGFALTSDSDTAESFYSKEGGHAPELVVEYVEPNTVTQTITETQTVTETQTITETQTETQTVTETTTIANTTITETQTITETITTTVANTTYYTTIYETISPAYGNETVNYYTDLANQLTPLVMVIGVICTMLSLLLSATKGR